MLVVVFCSSSRWPSPSLYYHYYCLSVCLFVCTPVSVSSCFCCCCWSSSSSLQCLFLLFSLSCGTGSTTRNSSAGGNKTPRFGALFHPSHCIALFIFSFNVHSIDLWLWPICTASMLSPVDWRTFTRHLASWSAYIFAAATFAKNRPFHRVFSRSSDLDNRPLRIEHGH